MKIIKEGKHNIFDTDSEVSRHVTQMLLELENNGMDAVRKYSKEFDDWEPDNFELDEKQIETAINECSSQLKEDTEICQNNVRRFANAQLGTRKDL